MKSRTQFIACFSTLLLASATVHADTEWIGPSEGDLFDPGNWSGNAPVAGVPFDENITMSNGSAEGGTLVLASGRTLSIRNFILSVGSFQGVLADSDDDSVLNAVDSTINCNNVALDAVVNLTGTSEMHIFAASPAPSRNTINGAGTANNGTKVTLSDGCKVVHENGNDAGNAGAQSVGQRIIRVVTGTSFATDLATAPLTEFTYSGPANPFAVATTSQFTITSLDANPPPSGAPPADILVGYALVPPQPQEVAWLPTVRTASDWQIDLNYPEISNHGWAEITDVYLADLNGDGMSDKVMRQTANNGGSNPSQIIATYTTGGAGGFATTKNFNPPNGDIEVPFGFLGAAVTNLVFGDLDGDGIDDSGITVDGGTAGVGGTAGALTWGIYKSAGVVGISTDQGAGINFVGWSVFGDVALGDVGYLGDFNGDGIADRMIRRVSSNQIFIDLSVAGNFGDGAPDYTISLGIAGDSVSVSDINGDGKDDLVLGRDNAPPQEVLPNDLQTIYGYYNDGTGFSTLNALSPDITDVWGFAPRTGFLFGNITPVAASEDAFKITQITSAGPDIAFSGVFRAIRAGNYQIEASLNLQAPWAIIETKEITTAVLTNFNISDTQLDDAFGPGARPKVFVRVVLLPPAP